MDQQLDGGGLVFANGGTIKNSYIAGEISTALTDNGFPSICYQSYGGTIKNCYSSIDCVNTNTFYTELINLIDYNESTVKTTIENCYNPSGIIVGRIDRGATVDIKNCYALGNVTGVRGGIVGSSGDRYNNLTTITLDNCYFKGRIDYTTDYSSYDVDGLVGDRGDKVTITNSKYLEKSLYLNGELQPDDENAATEEEMNTYMKSVLEVVNGDGAFKEDTNNINNGYPILSWQ